MSARENAVNISSAARMEFHGGEFVLTEQRPRMQSRVLIIPLHQDDAVVFAVHRLMRKSAY